jgi:hypothetical protein
MVGSIALASEVSLLLLVPTSKHKTRVKCAKEILRYQHKTAEDFAVVAQMHGLDPLRRTMIIAGISTLDTESAVRFVCDESSIKELLRQLNVKSGADMPSFEALLRVKIANDIPLRAQLVAVRRTNY